MRQNPSDFEGSSQLFCAGLAGIQNDALAARFTDEAGSTLN
jgi:hypothetical protein